MINSKNIDPSANFPAGLPRAFSATGLRSNRGGGADEAKKVHEASLSTIQTADEKVRELLIGRQLYGDPALAIRELYQNALDACRWRATRQEYQQRLGFPPTPWAGLIRFTQGTDEDDREYIECEDNGVGMDLDALTHVFLNAGERFVYGQDFRVEQAAWADLDPPLLMVPNSQFGIGVFSYFMVADEIIVTTRPQRRDGAVDAQAIEAWIASSTSLFRIMFGHANGGTRVRLYLSGSARDISVLETLRDLLWIADHRVEVVTPAEHQVWEPGQLHMPSSGPPLKCGDRLWWVPGMGGLAADGIVTNEKIFGLVVNLQDERRPQFTMGRKTLLSWDEEWVSRQVEDTIPNLVKWPGFTLEWLRTMADHNADLAHRISQYAIPRS